MAIREHPGLYLLHGLCPWGSKRQGCALDLLAPSTLLLSWQLIIYELQLWRLLWQEVLIPAAWCFDMIFLVLRHIGSSRPFWVWSMTLPWPFLSQACDLLPVLRASRASLHLEPLCAGAPAGKANSQRSKIPICSFSGKIFPSLHTKLPHFAGTSLNFCKLCTWCQLPGLWVQSRQSRLLSGTLLFVLRRHLFPAQNRRLFVDALVWCRQIALKHGDMGGWGQHLYQNLRKDLKSVCRWKFPAFWTFFGTVGFKSLVDVDLCRHASHAHVLLQYVSLWERWVQQWEDSSVDLATSVESRKLWPKISSTHPAGFSTMHLESHFNPSLFGVFPFPFFVTFASRIVFLFVLGCFSCAFFRRKRTMRNATWTGSSFWIRFGTRLLEQNALLSLWFFNTTHLSMNGKSPPVKATRCQRKIFTPIWEGQNTNLLGTENCGRKRISVKENSMSFGHVASCNHHALPCIGAMLVLCLRYFVSSSLIDLMTYVWGRKNSSARMQVWGFWQWESHRKIWPLVLNGVDGLLGWVVLDDISHLLWALGSSVGVEVFFFTVRAPYLAWAWEPCAASKIPMVDP